MSTMSVAPRHGCIPHNKHFSCQPEGNTNDNATTSTRAQIGAAGELTFPEQREKQANISIEAGLLGLTVRCEYTGILASIPAAIERLKQAGVLELVSGAARPATQSGGTQPARKPAQKPIEPTYLSNGAAVCPVHGKELQPGRFGLYCPSRATGDQAANDKGYCSLRFAE